MRAHTRAGAALAGAGLACALLSGRAPASEPEWRALDPAAALSGAPDAATPVLAREAAAGLMALYADALQGGAARETLQRAYDHGREAVKTARFRDERDGDPLLEASIANNAALLLELRVLEALAARIGTLDGALTQSVEAESLAAALRSHVETLPSGAALVWPLAAGIVPSRVAAAAVDSALLAHYRASFEDATLDPVWRWWAFHAAAARQPAWIATSAARTSQDGCEAARQAVAAAVSGGRVELFAAENPARRLRLAARVLREDGSLPPAADAPLMRVLAPFAADPAAYSAWNGAADSLSIALGVHSPRASTIHGSRRNFYRRAGEAAPLSNATWVATARNLAGGALEALRAARGGMVLQHLGWTVSADLDPVESVPGQAVCAVWSVRAGESARWNARDARVDDTVTSLAPASGELASGDAARLCTGYVAMPPLAPGSTLVVPVSLQLDLGAWGTVYIADRVAAHVVAPLTATLAPQGGMIWDESTKIVDVVVTSRAPRPLAGGLQVLGGAGWTVAPARGFQFTLRRPGQTARQQLVLTLPTVASPGAYELAVRLSAADETVGTLRARLVKPVQWAVIGPFSPPAGKTVLGPERGVTLESRFPGLNGAQVVWQPAPRAAYDDAGGLDFDVLYPAAPPAVCAVAFTVFESPEAGRGMLRTEGATRVRWNGTPPAADGSVRIERGRNLLLVRSGRDEGRGWRLAAQLTDLQGEPLHVVANDLNRLLDGYAALHDNTSRTPGTGPIDRLVTLRFRAASDAQDVAVLGTFNSWVPVGLQRQPDGTWQRELRLTPGTYAYKLLVDGRLRPDPEARNTEPDGFGGRNSVLIVH